MRYNFCEFCRTYAGIEMQMGRMSVAQAAAFFEANAFITPDAAEAEAIRGVYDPDYILYSIGMALILQLRADYRAAVEARGETFSLREFHDRFLSLGQYPLPVVRAKMVDGLPPGREVGYPSASVQARIRGVLGGGAAT